MDPFLNLDQECNFAEFELRDLISGRQKILTELDRIGPNGQPTADHEQRFDGLLDRATKLEKHIAQVEKGERRSTALASLRNPQRTGAIPTGAPAPIPIRGDEPAEERDLLANVDGGKIKYSLLRAVDLVSRNKPLDGLEGEVSQEIEKRSGKSATGFYIPWNLPVYHQTEQRDAFSTTGGAGISRRSTAPARSSPSMTEDETPLAPTSAGFGQAMSSIRQSRTRKRAGVSFSGSCPVRR